MLSPLLRQTCGGRLSEIEWFRSAWQAGGASTGLARFALRSGRQIDAVVKLPVGPSEYRWTVGVGTCPEEADEFDGPTPRVLAAGDELGGYDLAWLVLEKLPGNPLSASLSRENIDGLLHAAADWYARSGAFRPLTPDDQPRREDWRTLFARARTAVAEEGIAEEDRWARALERVDPMLDDLVERWESRPINCWCHGDLHPGNAMRRMAPGGSVGAEGGGRCVLIDLALVHPGHWLEDALYLERLFWGKPELLHGVRPVDALTRWRDSLGLDTAGDLDGLADTRRALMAATVPAFLEHEGHPRYVHAALERLEQVLERLPGAPG